MTTEMTGGTALARLEDLGCTLPPVGPDDTSPQPGGVQMVCTDVVRTGGLTVGNRVREGLDR